MGLATLLGQLLLEQVVFHLNKWRSARHTATDTASHFKAQNLGTELDSIWLRLKRHLLEGRCCLAMEVNRIFGHGSHVEQNWVRFQHRDHISGYEDSHPKSYSQVQNSAPNWKFCLRSDTRYMAITICVNIGSGNRLLSDGINPLPEPMLANHYYSPVVFILGHYHKIWRYRSVK